MALTTGFKRFVSLVVVFGAVSAGLWVGQKNNYWGILEKREKIVADPAPQQQQQQVTVQVPETPREVPAQVYAPENAPQSVVREPLPEQPTNNAAINKLKGLNKL